MNILYSKYIDDENIDAVKIRRLDLLSLLRLILAVIMTVSLLIRFNSFEHQDDINTQPLMIAMIYTAAALIGWRVLHTKYLMWQGVLFTQLMIDVILISLLVTNLGGSDGGYAVLYAIPIIAATTLLNRHLAFFIGAISFIALMLDALRRFILLHQSVDWLLLGLYGLAGFICISLLAMATERADKNEQLIRQTRLSADLVQEVQEQHLPDDSLAWVVFDHKGTVHLLNKGARSLAWQAQVLLEIGYHITPNSPLWLWFNACHTINDSMSLEQMIVWPPTNFVSEETESVLKQNLYLKASTLPQMPHMIALNLELEQTRLAREHQAQLVSMGRISASIAHEIRNPLGAISQAAELLQEGNGLNDSDKQLTDLMLHNIHRINRIISNLLLWSKGIKTHAIKLFPNEYFSDLIRQMLIDLSIPKGQVLFQPLDFSHPLIQPYIQCHILFDTDHLYQIINNLLSNALRYAKKEEASILVTLYPRGKHLGVCVIDNGEPVADSVIERLFEPFQTTAKQGTGLGLYLSRQYAIANHSVLQLFKDTQLLRLLHWEATTQLFIDPNYEKNEIKSYTKAFVLSIPWSNKLE